jgi:hypothetical protein
MATKRLDVVRKQEKEGQKTRWVRVGTIFLDSEKDSGTLYLDMFETGYSVFPSKPKPDAGGSW